MRRRSEPGQSRKRTRRRLRAVVPPVALVLAIGCTHQSDVPDANQSPPGAPETTTTQSAPARVTLPCDDPIGGANKAPRAPATLILDTVALSVFPPILHTVEDVDGPDLFAKVGLWIHAGHEATLSVAGLDGAEIRWRTDNPGPGAPTVDVPKCPATDVGTWLVYPGGFFVPRPACVTLTVTVDDRMQTLHVPVGRTCP